MPNGDAKMLLDSEVRLPHRHNTPVDHATMLNHVQAMLKEAQAFGKALGKFEKAVKKFEGSSGASTVTP